MPFGLAYKIAHGWVSKECETCGKAYEPRNEEQRFCSRGCYGSETRAMNMLRTRALPSFRRPASRLGTGLGRKCVCKSCGVWFRSKHGRRRYCDAHQSESKSARGHKGVRRAIVHSQCEGCGNDFIHAPHQKRKFCTYTCFVQSGEIRRAGLASYGMRKKYGVKKDANHKEIVEAFESLGAFVVDLSSLGCGVPDLLVWCWRGWYLVDVKNRDTAYGRRGLNKRQRDWATEWKGGPVYLVFNRDDVIAMVSGNLSAVKKFPEDRQ